MSNKWDSLSKPERAKLLAGAGLPTGLAQLNWSGLQKSERKKLEKGKGWFEAKEPIMTAKGIEHKAPEHHRVAIKKEAGKALNKRMERKEPIASKKPKEEKLSERRYKEWYDKGFAEAGKKDSIYKDVKSVEEDIEMVKESNRTPAPEVYAGIPNLSGLESLAKLEGIRDGLIAKTKKAQAKTTLNEKRAKLEADNWDLVAADLTQGEFAKQSKALMQHGNKIRGLIDKEHKTFLLFMKPTGYDEAKAYKEKREAEASTKIGTTKQYVLLAHKTDGARVMSTNASTIDKNYTDYYRLSLLKDNKQIDGMDFPVKDDIFAQKEIEDRIEQIIKRNNLIPRLVEVKREFWNKKPKPTKKAELITERQERKEQDIEEPKIRDTKIKHSLYQGYTYRQAIEEAISNMEVELKGGRVRVEGKRFTHLDKDNSLLSDPVYETKFWLEAYHDGRLIKLPLNRAEVDYYNKLKSEYKKPERVIEIETPERTRFYLQDRVDNARRALQQWTKMNDTAMIKTWEGYLAEREKELTEFDAGKLKQTEPQIQQTDSSNKGITWDATFSIGIPRKDGSTRRVNKSMTDLKVSSHQEAEAEVLKKYPKAYYIHIIQNNPAMQREV